MAGHADLIADVDGRRGDERVDVEDPDLIRIHPVLEDLAIVLDEDIPAERVEAVIRKAGGRLLVDIQLFDLYRGEQIGMGKKSLAFALVYQAPDRTLRDADVAKLREKVITKLDEDLGAKLRS